MRVNRFGFVERRLCGREPVGGDFRWRDWWLGKDKISLNSIVVPRRFWGKHIRFKIEVVE